jgi:hypothetical protein
MKLKILTIFLLAFCSCNSSPGNIHKQVTLAGQLFSTLNGNYTLQLESEKNDLNEKFIRLKILDKLKLKSNTGKKINIKYFIYRQVTVIGHLEKKNGNTLLNVTEIIDKDYINPK